MKSFFGQFTRVAIMLCILALNISYTIWAQVPNNFTCTSIQTNTLNSTGVINASGLNVSSTISTTGDISTQQDLNVLGDINLQGNFNAVPGSTTNLGALNILGPATFNNSFVAPGLGNGTGYQPVYAGPNGVLVTQSGPGNVNPSTSCSALNPMWHIGGDFLVGAGLSDGSVGTCDDFVFGVKVNNQNRLFFSNSLNNYFIGFGTTNPTQRYHFSNGNVLIDGPTDPVGVGNNIRLKIDGALDNIGINVQTNHSSDNNYNTKIWVNRNRTKAISVLNTYVDPNGFENFLVYGDGQTNVGWQPLSPNNA